MQKTHFRIPDTETRNPGKKRGVTLIEMATVVSVLLIFAAFAVPEILNMVERARRQNAIDGVSNLSEALEMYKSEWSYYPPQGSVFPRLADYEEITRYYSSLYMTQDVNAAALPGVKGVAIYTGLTGTACVEAVVGNKLTPTYKVTHCVKTDNTWAQTQDAQPTCCWTKGGVDCDNPANWYPCKSKM